MHKFTNSFGNVTLGPIIAIDGSRTNYQYFQEFLEEGFIPLIYIDNPNHQVFKEMRKEDKDSVIKAVIITVQYTKAYE